MIVAHIKDREGSVSIGEHLESGGVVLGFQPQRNSDGPEIVMSRRALRCYVYMLQEYLYDEFTANTTPRPRTVKP